MGADQEEIAKKPAQTFQYYSTDDVQVCFKAHLFITSAKKIYHFVLDSVKYHSKLIINLFEQLSEI